MTSKFWLIICLILMTSCSPSANYSLLTPTSVHFTQKTPTTFTIPTRIPSLTTVLTTGCVNNANLNVREGPGVEYSVIGLLSNGRCSSITGRNANSSWVFVESQGINGWVFVGYLSVIGDLARVPITNNSIPLNNTDQASNSYQATQPIYSPTVGNEPLPPPSYPPGATAICNDGTYSSSQHRSGTCSHHSGVRQWLVNLPP